MTQFQSAMDKLTITGNMMNDQMNAGMTDPSTDANVIGFLKIGWCLQKIKCKLPKLLISPISKFNTKYP